jgi:hypothetical protein
MVLSEPKAELPHRYLRAAYETAVTLYPKDVIHYRDGARIIARSDGSGGSDPGRRGSFG